MGHEPDSGRLTTAELRRALFRPPCMPGDELDDDEFPDDPTTYDGIPIFDEPISEEGTLPDPDPPVIARAVVRPPSRLWLAAAAGGIAVIAVGAVGLCGVAASGAAIAWTLLDTPGQASIANH